MNNKTNAAEGKEQFNVRLPKQMKRDAKTVAARLGWKNDELAKVAIQILFGTGDKLAKQKAKMAKDVAKELSLSFNAPDRQPDQELLAA